jgi:hypothetical protein
MPLVHSANQELADIWLSLGYFAAEFFIYVNLGFFQLQVLYTLQRKARC